MADVVTVLTVAGTSVKVGVAILVAAAFTAAALLVAAGRTGEESTLRRLSQAMVLGLLALAALSRGAPHANPLLFELYARFGVAGLAAMGGTVAAMALAIAARLRHGGTSEPPALRPLIAVLALAAGAAAVPEVAGHWNLPGWGDSLSYDQIAHRILRGDAIAGHGYYMPVFQYGTALLYWIFGHYTGAFQALHVALAPLTVLFMARAAGRLFKSGWAALAAAALAACLDPLRFTPHLLQIENWYIPMVAFALWRTTVVLDRPDTKAALWLGFAVGLMFETRTQGAIFQAMIIAAPLFAWAAPWRMRLRATVIAGLVFGAMMVPWTLRNAVVDGRLAPTGEQVAAQFVYTNVPSGFYGIRRDLGAQEIDAWNHYDDRAQMLADMRRHFHQQLRDDPMYFVRATPWRTLAFYGLLPPGVWAKAGPEPTDWRRDGKEYFLRVFPVVALLLASGIGLVARPGRVGLMLFGGIVGNLAVVPLVGFTEPRISYPVFLLHLLLAFQAVWAARPGRIPETWTPTWRTWRPLLVCGGVAAVALHLTLGRDNVNRVLPEPLRPTAQAPLSAYPELAGLLKRGELPPVGSRVRVVLAPYFNHHPVKYDDVDTTSFPDFARDPARETYYSAALIDSDGRTNVDRAVKIAIALAGAAATVETVREFDDIEAVAEVMAAEDADRIWLRAEFIRLVQRPGRAW